MTDVLIKGDGPAGLAAAITLRQKGKSVTVVQRETNIHQVRVGESLTSSALISLKELNLSNAFLAAGHTPCHGNSSCWGNDKLSFFDFIQSPLGSGWYIDRPMFNGMLKDKALEMGVEFTASGRTDELKNADDGWNYLPGNGQHQIIKAKIIIDASGRNGWLSRRLGVDQVDDDQQIAITTILDAPQRSASFHSLVESVKDGWWYVADFRENKTACIFFTDQNLHTLADLLNPGYLNTKKEQTLFVRHRLPGDVFNEKGKPKLTSASSCSLSQYAGPGWLAAGDAACAMDPLSSHGIAFALRSGIDAATAANNSLNGVDDALNQYNKTLKTAVALYREQRMKIYQMENRWSERPFWQRRHIST